MLLVVIVLKYYIECVAFDDILLNTYFVISFYFNWQWYVQFVLMTIFRVLHYSTHKHKTILRTIKKDRSAMQRCIESHLRFNVALIVCSLLMMIIMFVLFSECVVERPNEHSNTSKSVVASLTKKFFIIKI